jgi:hypothetical protein
VRRRLAAIAAIATLVMLLAAPAAFAASAKVTQPSDTVRGPTDVRVEITRDSRVEPISRARARLQRGGDTLGDWVDLACKQRCADDQLRQTWGPVDDRKLDPATGAPFTSGGALRNGEYELQVRVERGRFLDPLESTDRIRLSVPPSAPGDVTAQRDGDEVEVTWKKAPEPDVTGYRVERRDGDGWREVRTTSADSHVDEPGPGSHTYRVVALRDDGRGGTLEKASSEREVEIPEPEDDDPDGRSGNGNGDGDGDGNGDGGSGGSGDVDGEDEGSGSGDGAGNGDDAEEATEAEDRAGSSGERDRRTSSSARAPSLGSDRSGSIPSVFGRSPETADPDAFSEELDFGDARNGDGEDPDDDVVLSGGRSGTIDRLLDAERIATPIAVGLVLTATGMHLWRWLRVPGL